jgi:hypothetical protein
VSLLSDAVLADLYRMGVPRRDLDILVMERVSDDPRALFNDELGALASATREYGDLLVDAPSRAFEGT